MLCVISAACLLFVAGALLYQAGPRRTAFAGVAASKSIQCGLRSLAVVLFAVTLAMLASLQGWERGIPVWLGLFSLVFVAGLFLAAQRPRWHVPVAGAFAVVGIVTGMGVVL